MYKGPSCLMHSVDHGIFVKVLDLEILLVKTAKPDSLANDFEERFEIKKLNDASIHYLINMQMGSIDAILQLPYLPRRYHAQIIRPSL